MQTALKIAEVAQDCELIEFKVESAGILNLTKTMLDKSIIDANASILQLARLFGVEYEDLKANDRMKIPSLLEDGSEATVTFYKTARVYRRISVPKIK